MKPRDTINVLLPDYGALPASNVPKIYAQAVTDFSATTM